MASAKITFQASTAPAAQDALALLTARYGQVSLAQAEVIVCLGGDGFMLQTLHDLQGTGLAVYGMNCGTVGFLMNSYTSDDLLQRLTLAEEAVIHPLSMTAVGVDGTTSSRSRMSDARSAS